MLSEVNEFEKKYRCKFDRNKSKKYATEHGVNLSDFKSVYDFLDQLSKKDEKEMIHYACKEGLSEIRNPYKATPVIVASSCGNVKLTQYLIEGGCNREAVNKQGNNCLMSAAGNGKVDVVRYLTSIGFGKDWCLSLIHI